MYEETYSTKPALSSYCCYCVLVIFAQQLKHMKDIKVDLTLLRQKKGERNNVLMNFISANCASFGT